MKNFSFEMKSLESVGLKKRLISRGKIFLVNRLCPCKRNLCLLIAAGFGGMIVGETLRKITKYVTN